MRARVRAHGSPLRLDTQVLGFGAASAHPTFPVSRSRRLCWHASSHTALVSPQWPGFLPLPVPLSPSAPAIAAGRRGRPCLRHHAGIASCGGDPACSADTRCRVLQVFRSSLVLRRDGLPEAVETVTEMPCRLLFWSSVSAIVRWRPHRGQRDWNSATPGFTRHALH